MQARPTKKSPFSLGYSEYSEYSDYSDYSDYSSSRITQSIQIIQITPSTLTELSVLRSLIHLFSDEFEVELLAEEVGAGHLHADGIAQIIGMVGAAAT